MHTTKLEKNPGAENAKMTGGFSWQFQLRFLDVSSGMRVYVRPHLLSSPPEEEIAFAGFWFCG
jgi:hypothetical protein